MSRCDAIVGVNTCNNEADESGLCSLHRDKECPRLSTILGDWRDEPLPAEGAQSRNTVDDAASEARVG